MARQAGILKLQGAVDDINFFKSKGKFRAGLKGEISAAKRAGASMEKVRNQGQVFTRAASGSKVLRVALFGALNKVPFQDVHTRLVRLLNKVIKGDKLHEPGQRTITDGNLELLNRFNFNAKTQLLTSFFAPYTSNVDRVTGQMNLQVPAFLTGENVRPPQGATHFKLIATAAAVNFEKEDFVSNNQSSAAFPLNQENTAAITITNSITPNSTDVLFHVLGICFYQEVEGKMEVVGNGDSNALAIIYVSAA